MIDICIEEQLVDKRELRYITYTNKNMYFNILKNRYYKFKDAPCLESSFIFNDNGFTYEYILEQRQFIFSLRQYIIGRSNVDLDKQKEYLKLLNTLEHYSDAYNYLAEAQCQFYYCCVKREALMKLKDMIGEDNFYAGRMPSLLGENP